MWPTWGLMIHCGPGSVHYCTSPRAWIPGWGARSRPSASPWPPPAWPRRSPEKTDHWPFSQTANKKCQTIASTNLPTNSANKTSPPATSQPANQPARPPPGWQKYPPSLEQILLPSDPAWRPAHGHEKYHRKALYHKRIAFWSMIGER